jgi:UPF0271 protein
LPNWDLHEYVLDANAFYTGIPFLSSAKCYTTNLIFSEVKHLKKSYSMLEVLVDTGNLKIIEPRKQFLKKVNNAARESGDSMKLSPADLSVLALACQLNKTLISDDYAVENIARILNISFKSVRNKGIKDVRKWISFCSTCGKAYRPDIKECLICGNKLRRRFKKLQ